MKQLPALSTHEKLAVLDFMATHSVQSLQALQSRPLEALLQWLDESGLALYFLAECEHASATDHLSPELLRELRRRSTDNKLRTEGLIQQLAEVVKVANSLRVPYAVVKGFSLCPEFCDDISRRHQIDIDLLMRSTDAPLFIEALSSLGYVAVHDSCQSSDIALVSDSEHKVAERGYIYSAEHERRVELHTELTGELAPQLIGVRWQDAVVSHEINGVTFPALNAELMFVSNCLHVFSHVLEGWIRLSWMWELLHCVNRRRDDTIFWSSIRAYLRRSPEAEQGVDTVLELAAKAFKTTAPYAQGTPLSVELREWLNTKSLELLLAGFPGVGCELRFAFTSTRIAKRRFRAAIGKRIKNPLLYCRGTSLVGLLPDVERLIRLLRWKLQRTRLLAFLR